MNDKLDAKTAIKDTLPTVFGYIGIGLAFGIISSSVGISPFFVGAMSLFIYLCRRSSIYYSEYALKWCSYTFNHTSNISN